MPSFQVSEGIAHGLRLVDTLFESLLLEATLSSGDATSATFTAGQATLSITGQDLVFGTEIGDPTLTDGVLDSFLFTYAPGYYVNFTDLGLDVSLLAAAAELEGDETDTSALETLLYPLDWAIISNSQPDSFPMNHFSYDGHPIAYSGENDVWLMPGNDEFDASTGDDTVRGGGGNDTIWGGSGNDMLLGQSGSDFLNGQNGNDSLSGASGNDTLWGMAGDDSLSGGIGNDALRGGAGGDHLSGNAGNDILTGGGGADFFMFEEGEEHEHDIIRDFEFGVDIVQIQTDSTIRYVETDVGVNIVAGLLTIHLIGADIDQITSMSFLADPLV